MFTSNGNADHHNERERQKERHGVRKEGKEGGRKKAAEEGGRKERRKKG